MAGRMFVLLGLASAGCAGRSPGAAPASSGPAEQSSINANFLDPNLKVGEWVDRFEGESREVYARREALVASLGLQPGQAVADIGAGTGAFLPVLSGAVGARGRVYAVDISPKFLEHLRRRAAAEGLANVAVVEGTQTSVQLDPDTIDAAWICDTYHHFEHVPETLESLSRALRPGGRLFVVDFERIEGESSEWVLNHVRAGKAVFTAEIEAGGFTFVREHEVEGVVDNYLLEFGEGTQSR